MTKQGSSVVGVGVLTVLTVLLVLTLAVFSALTFSSARADLALARKNADTVTAYYAADAQAAALLRDFRDGPERSTGDWMADHTLEATIPMTEAQSLYISLFREVDGTVRILSWQTVPAQAEPEVEDAHLPVFDGTLPAG